jgi:hypothetical protein
MQALKTVNLGLRFLLELGALVALAYWGFSTGDSVVVEVVLGLGAPLAMAVVWGLFIAPKARVPLALPVRIVLELLVFAAAVAALAAAGQPALAVAFAVAVIVSELILYTVD